MSKAKTVGDYIEAFEPYLEILGDLANIVVHISPKPKPKDYAAIAMSTAGLAMKLRGKLHQKKKSLKTWFADNKIETWYIGDGFKIFIYDNADRVELVKKEGEDQILALVYGDQKIFIHYEPVGSAKEVSDNSKQSSGSFDKLLICRSAWGLKPETLTTVFEAIRKKCWQLENKYLYLCKDNGLSYRSYKDYSGYKQTKFIEEITNKIDLAEKHGFLGRGFLVLGKPGTGKTTGIDYVLSKYKKQTLRVNLDFLEHSSWTANNQMSNKAEFWFHDMIDLVSIVKPECVVFDDLDYIHEWDQKRLLHLFTELIDNNSIILATVNHQEKVLPALKRPGRLDEELEIEGIDPAVLETLVEKEDLSLEEKLCKVPISHLQEYRKRKKMYSREEGIAFIDEYLEKEYPPEDEEENSESNGSTCNEIESP